MAARDEGEPLAPARRERGAYAQRGAARDGLPSLALFGDALVAAARRPDDLADLPSLANFGAAARRSGCPGAGGAGGGSRWRPWSRCRSPATSGAATAVVLRETVVQAPDPAQVPDEQTPLAGTAVVSPVRASDPDQNALPWAIRVAKSKTGFTCTTVGQVKDGTFGLIGLDGVFRRLPGELSDACGQGGTLTGARIVAADDAQERALDRLRRRARREDSHAHHRHRRPRSSRSARTARSSPPCAATPRTTPRAWCSRFGDHTERHSFAAPKAAIPDPDGQQAWAVDRFVMGTRYAVRERAPGAARRPDRAEVPDRLPRAARLRARLGRRRADASTRATRARPASTAGTGARRPPAPSCWGVARTKQGDHGGHPARRRRAARAADLQAGRVRRRAARDRRPDASSSST